jgi:hypothetical protein
MWTIQLQIHKNTGVCQVDSGLFGGIFPGFQKKYHRGCHRRTLEAFPKLEVSGKASPNTGIGSFFSEFWNNGLFILIRMAYIFTSEFHKPGSEFSGILKSPGFL